MTVPKRISGKMHAPSVDAERGGKRRPQALHEGVPLLRGDDFLRLVVFLELGVLLLKAGVVLPGSVGLARLLGIPHVVARFSEILLQKAVIAAAPAPSSSSSSSFTLLTAATTGHGSYAYARVRRG